MKYNFYVRHAEEVDIPRILKESGDGAEAILLVSENAALLLSEIFLKRFRFTDSILVGGEVLHSNWGSDHLSTRDDRNAVIFSTDFVHGDRTYGWRICVFMKENISAVIKQLEAARAYVPRREVRVSTL